MNSGIYIRVGTEDKLLEQMTDEERHNWLFEKFTIAGTTEAEPLVRCIDILSKTLKWYEYNVDIKIKDEE